MLVVAPNPMIECLRLPKDLASAVEQLVRFSRGVTLPALQDAAQGFVWHGPKHGMNVVWHDHPRVKKIALFIEKADGGGSEIGDFRSSQPTNAVARVKEALKLAAKVPLDFLQLFGELDSRSQFLGCLLLRMQPMQPFRLLALKF